MAARGRDRQQEDLGAMAAGSTDRREAALVALPRGGAVAARSLGAAPYWRTPDFGVYLCSAVGRRRLAAQWTPTWRTRFVDWPPLGAPSRPEDCLDALGEVLRRVRGGERVEVGCSTGLLRTSTALAALAALDGLPPEEARRWAVRRHVGPGPLTPGQRRLVRRAAAAATA